MEEFTIRKITLQDDPSIARVIRSVLKEHGVDRPGTVYTDPATDHISEILNTPMAMYWVVEDHDELVGGCGIFPTEGLPSGYVELVKLYLLKDARGKGLGRKLIERSVEQAKKFGYTQMYLETTPELSQAVGLYEDLGFKYIEQRLGESGHFSCMIWMVKDL